MCQSRHFSEDSISDSESPLFKFGIQGADNVLEYETVVGRLARHQIQVCLSSLMPCVAL